MVAYVIFTREEPVKDTAALEQYQNINQQSPRWPGLTPRAIYGSIHSLEGDAPDGAIILEFPNLQAAKNWYHSEDYQRAIPYRKLAASYRAFIVEGL